MKPNNTIKEIMTVDLVTVSPDDPLKTVKKIFDKNQFHHLPVVEMGNRLKGIISREDYHKIYNALSKNTTGRTWTQLEISSLKAKDVMTPHPMNLDPDDTIGLAADIFMANKYHALPIVEDEQLIGIVTVHDLLAYCFAPAKEEMSEANFDENEVFNE